MRERGAALAGDVLRHPRHVALFALVAGLLLAQAPPAVVLAVAVFTLGALAALAWADDSPRSAAQVPAAVIAFAAAVAVLVGAGAGERRLDALDGERLAAREGQTVSVLATLLEPVRERGAGPAVARVRLAGAGLDGDVAVLRMRPRSHAGGWPEVGTVVAVAGRIAPLGRYDAYQRPRGAGGAIDAASLRRTGRRRGGIAGALDAVRRRAERGLEHGLHEREANLLRGMVLGQDERLDPELKTDFQRSGLAHLLAVSGQNVMLLGILVLFACRALGLPLRARLLLALALVAAYVPLAGGGPSIQRAGVMGAAGLVAALAGRPASRWYAIGLAAAVTLALNPLAAQEPGWQLSFAAVVALLVLCPPLRALFERAAPAPVAEAAAITVAATIGTAPLLAFHFEEVSLASLPANLAAAPAVAPIMWLGMLSAAAAQVSPVLAAPLNALDGPLLAYVARVARTAGAAPGAVVPVQIASPVVLALGCALPLALAAALRSRVRRLPPVGRRTPRAAIAVTAVVVLAVALLAVRPRPAFEAGPGELVVSFLEIGQGDATLIQRDGTSILVDTGPPGGPIVRRLAEAGVRRLDALVLTHAQADHEGEALAVMRAYEPRLVLDGGAGWPTQVQRALPAALHDAGSRRVDARAGQRIRLGEVTLEVLWPPPPSPGWRPAGDPNDRAVVAVVSCGSFDLLLPADAESNVTAALRLPRVEALKVAHHGSADAGLPALLERTRPAVAAIEVGRSNTYGHPAGSTLAALRGVPNVVRTDRDGTVRLRVSGAAMRLEKSGATLRF
jgi:competence protein ComEC